MNTLGPHVSKVPPRVPRLAELIAARLRTRIVSGELADGAELPVEAALLEEFAVSRPSLREAIRILETEGLLRIRRGKVGGAIVTRPTEVSAAYHLGLFLQSRGVTLNDLAEARSVLEPACVALAAGLPDDRRSAVVNDLRQVLAESESELEAASDGFEFTASALRFHTAIIELCGNVTMALLAGALGAVWNSQERSWAAKAIREGAYPDISSQRDVVTAHRRLVQLIAAGDVDKATRAMRSHLAKTQQYVDYLDVRVDVMEPAPAQVLGR